MRTGRVSPPTLGTNQILLYMLIHRALKYGIEIISVCVLSNHLHLAVRDVRGRPPDFMRDFLKQTSSAIVSPSGMIVESGRRVSGTAA